MKVASRTSSFKYEIKCEKKKKTADTSTLSMK